MKAISRPPQQQIIFFLYFFLKAKTILEAGWPDAGWIDESAVKASEYFMEAAHSLRLHLKNYLTPRKAKKGESAPPEIEKPTHAIIWVAKSFPPWQSTVLTCLKDMHDVSFCQQNFISSKFFIQLIFFLFLENWLTT